MIIVEGKKEVKIYEEEWSAPKELEDLQRKYLEYYALDNEPVCQSKDIGMVS